MGKVKTILSTVIFAAALVVGAFVNAAEPAGEVIAMKGDVTAQSSDGTSRALMKSDQVFVGDQVITGSGAYAVIQFIDGAKATLRPDSNLSINQYTFGTENDGAVLGLVKGGFRAITGEIAHNRPESFSVQTNVATLGVRGTEFAVRLCDKDCSEQGDDTAQAVEGVYGHGYFVSR